MDDADREVLAFFNKLVVDGRYLQEFTQAPAKVARELGVPLSRAGMARVKAYRIADVIRARGPARLMSPVAVAVVVAAIIVLWSRDARKVVIDRSGVIKM